jgi:sugar transferase (PEP-CTERM/EpsH1 system associated)
VNVLFVCHRFPYPPRRGGKIRPFHVIRHLSRHHQVTVAAPLRSSEEAFEGQGLVAHCRRVLAEPISPAAAVLRMGARLPTPRPSSAAYFWSPRLARRIREELAREPYHLIFVHCAFVAPYVAEVRNLPKLLDFGDMDSQKWLAYARFRRPPLSLGYALEGCKLRRLEAWLAARFDLATCTTKAEAATLESYGVPVRVGWFPNGVDADYFSPVATPYDPDAICFTGRMDYYPNQQAMMEFCRSVLPRIRARRPGASVRIVGAAPSRAIRRLGELPGVTVTGTVPDVRPYVRTSAVSVAPLAIARGTQNKVLEAMAMGVPVVASPAAAEGVDAIPGRHLLVAASPDDFAAAVVRVMDSPQERRRLAEAGRARVLSHHDWDRAMRLLDDLVDECRATFQARSAGAFSISI